jgi:uncharacterized protein (DUF1501 family)
MTLVSRRSVLAALAALAGSSALAPSARADGRARARSCILLWMNGGPSHVDTWDPKSGPTAGPLRSIETRVKGTRIGQHLPLLADRADRLAIVRGMTSKEGSHDRAQQLGHTGYTPNPTVDAPSLGGWVARQRGGESAALPPFVSLAGPAPGAGFLGRAFDPYVVQDPGELPQNLVPSRDVGAARRARREAMLRDLDRDLAARTGQGAVAARGAVHDRAVRLATSPEARLFDLSGESPAVLARYGDTRFGRGCLVARRLVEAKVPFVEVVLDGWDTHADNFGRVQRLCGALDPAMSALLDDLRDRGLDDDVVVLWMGEFGRTPRISGADGRDHHPRAWSAVLAGAGIRGGTVHGETDGEGSAVVRDATSIAELHATVATAMGLDPGVTRVTPEGRPFSLTDGGKPIAPILAS